MRVDERGGQTHETVASVRGGAASLRAPSSAARDENASRLNQSPTALDEHQWDPSPRLARQLGRHCAA